MNEVEVGGGAPGGGRCYQAEGQDGEIIMDDRKDSAVHFLESLLVVATGDPGYILGLGPCQERKGMNSKHGLLKRSTGRRKAGSTANFN